MQCPVIFKANTAFPGPAPPFSVAVENPLDPEEMASLLFGSTYPQLCPPSLLFWLEICLKAFHTIHGMKIFVVIAEIGTGGWATTDCFCKALSGCFLGFGWGSGHEWHNCRARKDQASRFVVNILNRKGKRGEKIGNHLAKLQYVVKDMMSATARKTVEGGNLRKH